MRIKGRTVSKGIAKGKIILSKEPITFLGGVDPKTGIVIERGHELEGKSVNGKILVFPKGKGSTVGSYVIYQMKKNSVAPAGIINVKAEQIVASGAIISEIPMIHDLDIDVLGFFKEGENVILNGDEGYVEVTR
ncbi:MAG: DUF126 domain-containing protein [Candidatus Hydrothermarchaeales archaeon]